MFVSLKNLVLKILLVCLVSASFVNAMEQPWKTPPSSSKVKQSFFSPAYVEVQLHNYCKAIIDDLGVGNLNGVKKEFRNFYKQIPYPLKKAGYKKWDSENFYRALFYSLFLCIAVNSEQKEAVSELTYDEETGTVFLPIKVNDRKYILQFRAFDEEVDEGYAGPEYKFYDEEDEEENEIKVIAIDFFTKSKVNPLQINQLDNNYYEEMGVKFCEIVYKEDNFFKQMIINCLGRYSKSDLKQYLESFYNHIPKAFHIDLEQFYQTLFYGAITFIGSNSSQPEFTTSLGRADVIVITPGCVNVIEFKRNSSVDVALKQIEDRDYTSFFQYQAPLKRMVGINVNTKTNGDEVIVTTLSKRYEQEAPSPMAKIFRRRVRSKKVKRKHNDKGPEKKKIIFKKRQKKEKKEKKQYGGL